LLTSNILFIQKQGKGFKILEEELGVLALETFQRLLPRRYGNRNAPARLAAMTSDSVSPTTRDCSNGICNLLAHSMMASGEGLRFSTSREVTRASRYFSRPYLLNRATRFQEGGPAGRNTDF